jgi:hypothetical protein
MVQLIVGKLIKVPLFDRIFANYRSPIVIDDYFCVCQLLCASSVTETVSFHGDYTVVIGCLFVCFFCLQTQGNLFVRSVITRQHLPICSRLHESLPAS